jgi:hypothetical protein
VSHPNTAARFGRALKLRSGVVVGAALNVGDGCGAFVYDDLVWIPLTGE